jgi:hypothetical protein
MVQLVTARASSSNPTASRDGLLPLIASAASVSAHSISLDLAPLLLPYKKHGRLGLRVERLQQRARLSRGRNNGDGSWSLASDELEDLAYQPPEGTVEARSLTIRVIALDQEGTTLAVLDFPLSDGKELPSTALKTQAQKISAKNLPDKPQLARQHDELEILKSTLAVRESELTEARRTIENSGTGLFLTIETALAKAETGWKVELEGRLAKAEESAQKRLTEARKRWQRKTEDAISSAEKAWKVDEATRMAAAEAVWQEKSRTTTADADQQTARVPDRSNEIETLREELASMAAILAHRDSTLAQAHMAAAEAREHWRIRSEAALSNAEKAWKTDEAARAAAVEALWREQSEKSLAGAKVRWEAAEAALAKARMEIDSAASDKVELFSLRAKLEAMVATLADRDAALAQAHLTTTQTRERAQKASAAAIENAKAAWEAEVASRLEAAEAQWRQRLSNSLAEATARFENAEIALAQVRVRAEAARTHSDEDAVSHLNEELMTLRVMLADRERELAQARLTPGAREFPAWQDKIALRSDREWDTTEQANPWRGMRITPRLVRDIALAGVLAASAIIFYPRIAALVPESSRPNIAAIAAGLKSVFNGPAVVARSPMLASHDVAAQPLAVVVHAANLRARSSASASIISTLRLGAEVATIQRQGNWTLVRVDDKNNHAGSRLGWVYSAFLKGGDSQARSTSGIHL